MLLEIFGALSTDALSDFGGRIGVVEMPEGRLRAAGSMSGILESRLVRPFQRDLRNNQEPMKRARPEDSSDAI